MDIQLFRQLPLCASWYEKMFHKYLVKTQAQCTKLMLPKKLCLPIARSHTCHGLRLAASSPCNNALKSFLKSYSYFQTTAFSVFPKNIQICSFIINISENLKGEKSRENTAEVHEKFEFINFSFTFSSPPCLHFNISILLSHNGRLLCKKVQFNNSPLPRRFSIRFHR